MVADLLDTLLTGTLGDLAAAELQVRATIGRGDTRAVARAEQAVRQDPDAITFDSNGSAIVVVDEFRYGGGRFDVPTIAELRRASSGAAEAGIADARLWVVEGSSILTDIGALQAHASEGTLFQLASQFNCLESPGPQLARVRNYLTDPTQGPRGAVSAFPATLVRNYAAPDGPSGHFVQTPDRQLNLLADALPTELARVASGYLQTQNITDLPGAAHALEANFEQIRVGVHADAEVVLGAAWSGSVEGHPRIAQACTSTLAAGGYSRKADPVAVHRICRQLLRAAYLGTLLAARREGCRRVVLTLIGGGVFANPHPLILESAIWAVRELRSVPSSTGVDVILNARALDPEIDRDQLGRECAELGGGYRRLPG